MIEIPDYMNPEKIDPDLKQSLIDICQYLGLSMSFYYLQGRAVIPDKRRIKKFLDTEDYKYQLPISTNKTTEILAAVMDYLTFAESNVLELLVVNSDMAMLDEELFPFALRRATEAIKEDMEVNDNDKQGNDSEVQGTSKK
jgi:ACT domain-containing protein